jgi:hypothetical protein
MSEESKERRPFYVIRGLREGIVALQSPAEKWLAEKEAEIERLRAENEKYRAAFAYPSDASTLVGLSDGVGHTNGGPQIFTNSSRGIC